MEVQKIITLKGWVDGSGWSYQQEYDCETLEITEEMLTTEPDWSWYVKDEDADGSDVEITVAYYAVNADPCEDRPLAIWSVWASDIEDNTEDD